MLYENVYSTLQIMQEKKRLERYPLTLNGVKTWLCLLLVRRGRWALCICHVFGLQMISETRRTSVVTHFMSTVHADNFCHINQTIWQYSESEFAVPKSILHFLSLSLFSLFFSNAIFSYSSATLWIKTIGAINGRKSKNARCMWKQYRNK